MLFDVLQWHLNNTDWVLFPLHNIWTKQGKEEIFILSNYAPSLKV